MNQIKATIIKDSVYANDKSKRITTFEVEYPRMIHCFDDKTEILCRSDANPFPVFRKFSEIYNDKEKWQVSQVDKDELTISFAQPTNWIKNNHKGTMVTLEGNRIDFSVTDKHRLLVGSRKSKGFFKKEVILAEELLDDFTTKRFYKKGLLLSTVRKNPNENSNFYELVGYFIGDGHTPKVGNQSQFHFVKERKIRRVKELLDLAEYPYTVSCYGDKKRNFVIRFETKPWMLDCYTESGDKTIPDTFWNISKGDFNSLLAGLIDSDGCRANNEFNTFSTSLIEKLQALCHINDVSFNLKKYDKCYKVSFLIEDSPVLRKDKVKPELTKYDGDVYCVTVPSGFVMVRRNGIVHVSGNCEIMTHRMFSRNAASSRAIPIDKYIEMIEQSPAQPVEWGLNKSGMQAEGIHTNPDKCSTIWNRAAQYAVQHARILQEEGLHKQIVNRLLEPFMMMKTIITTTEVDNFFWLRDHADADPTLQALAKEMKRVYEGSVLQTLWDGEWHLPYVDTCKEFSTGRLMYGTETEDGDFTEYDLDTAIKISCSCCAQVSYRKLDDSVDKALQIYDRLVQSNRVHASALEHCATPTIYTQNGVTHIDRDGELWSGNFKGWVQYRQLVDNHVCNDYKQDDGTEIL